MKIAVMGGGSWGTALAHALAGRGESISIWAREPQVVEQINSGHENQAFLPGIPLPLGVVATMDAREAMTGAEMVLLVVPTQYLRSFVRTYRDHIPTEAPLLVCSKGIEKSTLMLGHEILLDELPAPMHGNVVVLSGPSFAREVAEGHPTNVTVAAASEETARSVQHKVSTRTFRSYSSTDTVGVGIGGACKNVLAIACGAATGLGYGFNSQAGLITRGLAEMTRLAVSRGGNPLTMSGLAGLGDLVLTCTGSLSRNRMVGLELARGMQRDDIIASMKMVAEGIDTSESLYQMALQQGVDMPITTQVYRVLHEGKPIAEAVEALLDRSLKEEIVLSPTTRSSVSLTD